jgi:D-serine deaminase-like pyridoxal phosphate-dependent protein
LRWVALALRLGDSGAAGEDGEGGGEVHIFYAHDEVEEVATSATTEAVEDALLRVNIERGFGVGVEGAETDEAPPHLAQAQVSADYAEQVGASADFFFVIFPVR